MSTGVELRRGVYRDSVTLTRVSEAIIGRSGVEAAIVAMATPLNVELYERLGFDRAAVAHMPIRTEDVWRAMHDKEPIGNWITKEPVGRCRSARTPVAATATR
jgi:hypothetical protein